MSELKPIKAAVVGVGIGKLHVEGYQMIEGVDVVAICDKNLEAGRKYADERGVKHTYGDMKSLLDNEELDVVSVAVPNVDHAELAIMALEKGVPVLLEKPMANTLANAERIRDVQKATGTPLMMGYNNRHRTESIAIRNAVKAGELGRVYYSKCGWVRRQGIPGLGGWFTTKAMSGGGPMMDIGVHALDLTMWLLGFPKVASVSGCCYSEFGPRGLGRGDWSTPTEGGTFDVEDLAAGFIRFEDGGTLILEASWAQFMSIPDRLYSSLSGTEGGADVAPFKLMRLQGEEFADVTPEVKEVEGHHAEVKYYVDCLRKGITPDGTVDQGVAVMQILNAIMESARTGHEVRL